MSSYQLSVTAAAVAQLKQMESSLQENGKQVAALTAQLEEVFQANENGLGPHGADIRALLEEMGALARESQYEHNRLALKVHTSAMLRQSLLEENPYREISQETRDVARFRGELYSRFCQKLRKPRTKDTKGNLRGHWEEAVFVPEADYVPSLHNPEGKTFGQICQTLERSYGISVNGIPYRDGYGDFSGISLAQIDWQDVAQERIQKDPSLSTEEGPDNERIFADRGATAACADSLAAQRGLKLPGLEVPYTKTQLERWREKNGFSWEESVHHGYLLVPTVIHSNVSHTGLVGIMTGEKRYTLPFAREVQKAAGAAGRLRIRPDGIGKVIYRGKGLRLHRNGRY